MYERVPPVFIDDVGKQAYDLHREAQSAEGEGDHMTAMRLYRHCGRLLMPTVCIVAVSLNQVGSYRRCSCDSYLLITKDQDTNVVRNEDVTAKANCDRRLTSRSARW